MEDPRALVTLLVVLGYALVSARLERRWISMPMVMVVTGFALGAGGLGLWEIDLESQLVRTAAEVTLALMLFHDAVRIDLRALREGVRIPLRLLGIGLPVMILAGSFVAWGMAPGIGIAAAALLAAMLAPTDAALGEAVVSDKRIPISIRQGLNVESGLNDGLSVPVFLVLLAYCADPGSLESGALAIELARQIGFGLLGGVLIGGVGGFLFKEAADRGAMLDAWRRIAILTISLGCFIAAAVLGGSGFIGAFAGGVVFGLVSEARSASDNSLTEQLGSVFDALSFILVGAMLLPFALEHASSTVVLYALFSLVLLRPLSVAVAMAASGARIQTVGFMGWFGPRGLATVVFTILLLDAKIPNGEFIASVAVFAIVMSVVAHGLSAPPLVGSYSRWWDRVSKKGSAGVEGAAVHEHRGRWRRTASN